MRLIFALPRQEQWERQGVTAFTESNKGYYCLESNEKVCAYALGIDLK